MLLLRAFAFAGTDVGDIDCTSLALGNCDLAVLRKDVVARRHCPSSEEKCLIDTLDTYLEGHECQLWTSNATAAGRSNRNPCSLDSVVESGPYSIVVKTSEDQKAEATCMDFGKRRTDLTGNQSVLGHLLETAGSGWSGDTSGEMSQNIVNQSHSRYDRYLIS
jgi:hypothetical protein